MFAMKWQAEHKRVVWVIGASSGIGLALTSELLAQGHIVIASSRKEASLLRFYASYPDRFHFARCDVTNRESVNQVVKQLNKLFGFVDTLIYNAGICEYIDQGNVNSALVENVFDTNLFGLTRVLEASRSLVRPHCGAQIAAVSSSAAYVALPRAEAYGASKIAMSYFMHALRLSLSSKGISVNVISPGFVKTPLTDKNDFPMPMMISEKSAALDIIRGLQRNVKDIHFPKRFTLCLKLLGALPLSLQQRLTTKMVQA